MTQENGLLREQVKTLEDQLNAPDKADSDDEPLNNFTRTQSRKEVRLLEAKVRELERVSIILAFALHGFLLKYMAPRGLPSHIQSVCG